MRFHYYNAAVWCGIGNRETADVKLYMGVGGGGSPDWA